MGKRLYLNILIILHTLKITLLGNNSVFILRVFNILFFFFLRTLSENKESNICERVTAEEAKTVLTLKKFFSGLKQKQVHLAYQSLCSGTHE